MWTVPNALSALRLLLVPVVAYLIGRGERDVLAVALLAMAALTDWLDGKIARRFDQVTQFGALLDPFADRLAIILVALALTVRGVIPVVLACCLALRDLMLLALLPTLRSRGMWALPVTFIGKSATFALLFGLVTAYATRIWQPATHWAALWSVLSAIAASLLWLGAALYWYAGVDYLRSVVRMTRPQQS